MTKKETESKDTDKKHKDAKSDPKDAKVNPKEVKSNPKESEAAQKDKLITSLTEMLQRLQAEFDNYRKRTDGECQNFKKYAEEGMIKSLLPVLDTFEFAFASKDKPEEFYKGVEMIYAQLYQMLEEKGLVRLQSEGEKFDPREHEALLTEESKGKENVVLEELQKGYKFNEKIIRMTKVKVSKKS